MNLLHTFLFKQKSLCPSRHKRQKINNNFLNLPERVYPETSGADTIKFIYDATGVKWQKIAILNGVTTTTDYIGSFIYDGVPGSMNLDYVLTDEGTIDISESGDFHRIRIKNDSTEYSYFNLDGWVSVNSYALQYIPSFKRKNLVNSNYLIVQKSSDNDVLLFAFGYAYASDPGLLSIINLTRFRKSSIIFNDEFFLYDFKDLNNDSSLDIVVTKNISSNEKIENKIESKTYLLKGGAYQYQSNE